VKSAWVLAPGEFEGSEYHKSVPQNDIDSTNITCGRDAFDFAAQTETADVLAGSEVGFKVSWAAQGNPGFWHPGPVQIYMSRAPKDDLASYRGDGDWFKIAYGGPANNTNWLYWAKTEVSFASLHPHDSACGCRIRRRCR
jgi:hypothetical protein